MVHKFNILTLQLLRNNVQEGLHIDFQSFKDVRFGLDLSIQRNIHFLRRVPQILSQFSHLIVLSAVAQTIDLYLSYTVAKFLLLAQLLIPFKCKVREPIMILLILQSVIIGKPVSRCDFTCYQIAIIFIAKFRYLLSINTDCYLTEILPQNIRSQQPSHATPDHSNLDTRFYELLCQLHSFMGGCRRQRYSCSSVAIIMDDVFCVKSFFFYSGPSLSVRSQLSIVSDDIFFSEFGNKQVYVG